MVRNSLTLAVTFTPETKLVQRLRWPAAPWPDFRPTGFFLNVERVGAPDVQITVPRMCWGEPLSADFEISRRLGLGEVVRVEASWQVRPSGVVEEPPPKLRLV